MHTLGNFFDGHHIDIYHSSKNDIYLARDAGWHFSSMLDDAGITKKMTGAADYHPGSDIKKQLLQTVFKDAYYKNFRAKSLHPNGYFGFVWEEDNELPP